MNTRKFKPVTPEEFWAGIEELRKQQAETSRVVRELGKKVGGIDDSIGDHAEQFFQDSLAQTLTFGGERYDYMYPNFKSTGKENCEFDIVLINGKSVAIIEAKHKIRLDDVKKLTQEKIAAFRRLFPHYQKHKVYLGIAGFSFTEAVKNKAKELGIGIIKQVGKSIELDDKKLKAY